MLQTFTVLTFEKDRDMLVIGKSNSFLSATSIDCKFPLTGTETNFRNQFCVIVRLFLTVAQTSPQGDFSLLS